MAQFDIYGYQGLGLLLDVQAELLDGLTSRMVVPLLPLDAAPIPAKKLNPIFLVGDTRYMMATQFMASVSLVELGDKVGSLAHEHYAIKPAIDMLFDGV
jgi:toxin CcdB